LRKFKKSGAAALKERVAKGRDPKLRRQQALRIRGWILGKDPRPYGFESGLWTRRIVQALIRKRLAVSLGLTAVGRLLTRLDVTPQKPLRRAYERDPQAVSQWQHAVYPALKKRAKRRGAKIFFSDEAGFQSDPPLRRTYGLKGQTPIVPTSGQRQSINAISAVTARGDFWSITYDGKLNAQVFVLFLRNFMRSRKRPAFFIVDGHPAHRARSVREYIASQRGRLELHFLPPYAPDLNPDEFVWNHMKSNGVAKKPLKMNESLRRRVEKDLRKLANNPKLLRSFFSADSVAYAKD
jgi:transposase